MFTLPSLDKTFCNLELGLADDNHYDLPTSFESVLMNNIEQNKNGKQPNNIPPEIENKTDDDEDDDLAQQHKSKRAQNGQFTSKKAQQQKSERVQNINTKLEKARNCIQRKGASGYQDTNSQCPWTQIESPRKYKTRNKLKVDEDSDVSHRMFHWNSLQELFAHIFKYKCTKCDSQTGLQFIPNESSNLQCGFNFVYKIHCTCGALLDDCYTASPRIKIQSDANGDLYAEKCGNKHVENSGNLMNVLWNMVSLQHGAQNTLLQTISCLFDLPLWTSGCIAKNKKIAAKLLRNIADKSVEKAKEEEREFIVNHPAKSIKMRVSYDGAYAGDYFCTVFFFHVL